jgi:hypothetical protein
MFSSRKIKLGFDLLYMSVGKVLTRVGMSLVINAPPSFGFKLLITEGMKRTQIEPE